MAPRTQPAAWRGVAILLEGAEAFPEVELAVLNLKYRLETARGSLPRRALCHKGFKRQAVVFVQDGAAVPEEETLGTFFDIDAIVRGRLERCCEAPSRVKRQVEIKIGSDCVIQLSADPPISVEPGTGELSSEGVGWTEIWRGAPTDGMYVRSIFVYAQASNLKDADSAWKTKNTFVDAMVKMRPWIEAPPPMPVSAPPPQRVAGAGQLLAGYLMRKAAMLEAGLERGEVGMQSPIRRHEKRKERTLDSLAAIGDLGLPPTPPDAGAERERLGRYWREWTAGVRIMFKIELTLHGMFPVLSIEGNRLPSINAIEVTTEGPAIRPPKDIDPRAILPIYTSVMNETDAAPTARVSAAARRALPAQEMRAALRLCLKLLHLIARYTLTEAELTIVARTPAQADVPRTGEVFDLGGEESVPQLKALGRCLALNAHRVALANGVVPTLEGDALLTLLMVLSDHPIRSVADFSLPECVNGAPSL